VGYIRDIYFKDSLNGVLCGLGGLVNKTTNGGLNWFEPNIQLNGNLYNFYKVSFVNNQYGWLVGNGNPVYRSTDFGMNWDSIGYISGSDEIYFSVFSSVLTAGLGGLMEGCLRLLMGDITGQEKIQPILRDILKKDIFITIQSAGLSVVVGGFNIQPQADR